MALKSHYKQSRPLVLEVW